MEKEQIIHLTDGRRLSYAEYGVTDGFPIFYFTGGNSSRLEGLWFATTAVAHNIRLIVPDRPGFGLSTPHARRTLLSWSEDVIALAEQLDIAQFSIFGLSGGGPHVLATAVSIPERLHRVAVISGTAPPTMNGRFHGMWFPVKLIFWSAKHAPRFNRFLLKQMSSFYSNPNEMKKRMVQALPMPDVQLITERPEVIDIFAAATQESHRFGIDGDAREWQLYVNDWGFELDEVMTEVNLWYGRYDRQVPIGMGHYLAQNLPNAILNEVEDGGHFSTINNYITEIFEYLTSVQR